MAIRTIVKEEEFLRKKCRPVTAFDDRLATILDDMGDTLKKAEGCGLAAPQVGILRRICIVDVGDGVIEMVNPEIIKTGGSQHEAEGCLSFPGRWGVTERPKKVKVRFCDRNGKEVTMSGSDLLARAFCHEIDHLDGVLFLDKVIEWIEDDE